MRRSLLLRLFVLSLAVAAIAVAATAWLTTQSTSSALRGEFERTYDADTYVYSSFLDYAGQHNSWNEVNGLVEDLASQIGRRVALTTPEGQLISDSARLMGEAAPRLPANPTARIDVISGDSMGYPIAFAEAVPAAPVAVSRAYTAVTAMSAVGGDGLWGLTPAEKDERNQLVQKANDCLAQEYPDANVQVDITGYPAEVTLNKAPTPSETAPSELNSKVIETILGKESPCVPAELYRPSNQALAYNQAEIKLTARCLDEQGVEYQVNKGPDERSYLKPKATEWKQETKPLPTRSPGAGPEPTSRSESLAQPEAEPTVGAGGGGTVEDRGGSLTIYESCFATAQAEALRPYVAPAAVLYLGSSERFEAFSADGWWRTATTALAVLVVAAGITLLGGQRLVRPIQALTTAAQRMEAGERTARVPVSGTDEVARLGHAFNSMASSIEVGEQQRRALVSDVAHELRTPLANVRGYLEAAEDGVVPLDAALVRSLLEEASLLERLVTDLQMLAQADAGMLRIYPEDCDATDVTAQVVASHRAAADAAGVALSASTPSSLPIHADPHRVRQALGNLVANALRFTPSGGSVVVSVEQSGRQVVWTVSDTGPGIAPEHLPHLFDRFYRADPSRSRSTGGSGLGLAIVRHLVEAHGGQVEVASEVGRGSTFVIRLPVSTTTV
jgi:two-component system, OmpR family, sensor histidine kinase BaeS